MTPRYDRWSRWSRYKRASWAQRRVIIDQRLNRLCENVTPMVRLLMTPENIEKAHEMLRGNVQWPNTKRYSL